MVGLLQYAKDIYISPPRGKVVIQDLEYAMRTKGGLTRQEDNKLRILNSVPSAAFVLFSGFGSFVGWFEPNYLGFHLVLDSQGFVQLQVNLKAIQPGTDPVQILTKHSDDEYLVESVKRHFFAEHLFDDLHQDQPFFRWHPRRSYTNSAFVERMKEIEATNSDGEARTVSGGTTADNGPSGDLMEDPFACILGSPGDVESNNPPGNISTVLKRSELRARRRGHRHHHRRHADDKFAAL
ncbi:uncharacterized protein C2845_PM01G41920 [Panicum miliaceum]|uniref:Uncharacterized protein n=1 Tax=Panicum miliaceum TaxID=4540 RepID=A0A3L6TVZ4_PANMI|nr:uncharacterized protein C2845_PM01G41920 [Panicum miliaceum]